MANERILIVDDEEDVLELVRYNLERGGYHVETAASGEQALANTKKTGCRGEMERFVGVYASLGPQGRPVVIVVYAGSLKKGGAAGASEEVQEVRWFAEADLPWDEFAFPSTVTALRDFLTSAPPKAPA